MLEIKNLDITYHDFIQVVSGVSLKVIAGSTVALLGSNGAGKSTVLKAVSGILEVEEGDIEEAMNAASAVGDDRIQRRTQGYVVPDAFTHGTSEQRKRWFLKGYNTGDLNQGNTFGEQVL